MTVRAKKHLGQHFLRDENIARNIVNSLTTKEKYKKVLEVGPGMGVLTKYLLHDPAFQTFVIDIDVESIEFLKHHFPELKDRIISGDFLKINLETYFTEPFAIIGNFPYNISSQILFKVLENRNNVPLLVGMFQKEVAERVAAKPGNKTYGILSVLVQAYYTIEYLFTVSEHVFSPPPKVKSAVIRISRNDVSSLPCNEVLFHQVVKAAFNQRRKTLRNALKKFTFKAVQKDHSFLKQRAEELSVANFIELTNAIE